MSTVSFEMEELRGSLNLYAYNILGSYDEAKDIVQDVFMKFTLLDQQKISNKKSFLIRMVINLAIDRKRQQKQRRMDYPGQWLPEPVATENPETSVYRKEILSYSMLVLLEKLDSKERAVFILREAFDYDHEEIADVIGISVQNSRKILQRAKNDLKSPLPSIPIKRQHASLSQYLKLIKDGNTKELEELLKQDITVISDGGGKAAAFRNVIQGANSVSALLTGLHTKYYKEAPMEGWINHQPALFYFEGNKLTTCQIFSLIDNQIDHIFFIRNPDKLRSLQNIFVKGVTFFPPHSS
jgi:RNA polymerase sigma-70 factor (ECF subfamily)